MSAVWKILASWSSFNSTVACRRSGQPLWPEKHLPAQLILSILVLYILVIRYYRGDLLSKATFCSLRLSHFGWHPHDSHAPSVNDLLPTPRDFCNSCLHNGIQGFLVLAQMDAHRFSWNTENATSLGPGESPLDIGGWKPVSGNMWQYVATCLCAQPLKWHGIGASSATTGTSTPNGHKSKDLYNKTI